MAGGELPHVAPRFGLGRDAVRRVAHRHAGSGVRHREAAAGGEQTRAPECASLPDVKRQDAPAGAGFEHRGDAVIREPIELVEQVVCACNSPR